LIHCDGADEQFNIYPTKQLYQSMKKIVVTTKKEDMDKVAKIYFSHPKLKENVP